MKAVTDWLVSLWGGCGPSGQNSGGPQPDAAADTKYTLAGLPLQTSSQA
jgi:hypothetical protein